MPKPVCASPRPSGAPLDACDSCRGLGSDSVSMVGGPLPAARTTPIEGAPIGSTPPPWQQEVTSGSSRPLAAGSVRPRQGGRGSLPPRHLDPDGSSGGGVDTQGRIRLHLQLRCLRSTTPSRRCSGRDLRMLRSWQTTAVLEVLYYALLWTRHLDVYVASERPLQLGVSGVVHWLVRLLHLDVYGLVHSLVSVMLLQIDSRFFVTSPRLRPFPAVICFYLNVFTEQVKTIRVFPGQKFLDR